MIEVTPPVSVSGSATQVGPPEFVPHPLLGGGHTQTIAGRYFWNDRTAPKAECELVSLEEGDQLCVLTSMPAEWSPGHPVAILVHGLAGCANAPYVVRLARRLLARGIGVIRMNLRGAGEGFGLARGIYHAGRSEDLRQVAMWLATRAPGSPIGLVGFSLGGNLVLKLAAEAADLPVPALDCVVAANPPIDLASCARAMERPENRIYDWNFVRWLRREVSRLHRAFPELGAADLSRVQSVYDFDHRYTAPRNGFTSADNYYRCSSSLPLLPRILLPGLVIHAEDDPFVPAECFRRAQLPRNLPLELIRQGGHLGYVSRRRWQGDRRWLEARITAWLCARWQRPLFDYDRAWPSSARGRAIPGASLSHA